jgi:hypothetical protein
MKRAENMEILEQRKTKAMERMAKSNFRLFMLSFLKDLSPYIVLALIIIVIVVLIKGGGRLLTPLYMLDSKRRSAFSSVKGIRQRTIDYFKVKFGGLFEMLSPGYKVRLFFGMFSPFGGVKYNAIPRPRLYSGRCDNLRWIQQDNNGRVDLSQDGAAGKCFSAVRPKDIVWNLDISKMPDFYDLPQIRQDALKDKMRITIPYDSEDSIRDGNTFFVPRCDKAYYGSDRKNLVNQGKGKMALEDTGTTCRLVAHPLSKAKYSVSNATQSKLAKLLERIKTSG